MPKERVNLCNKAHTLARENPSEFCVNASGQLYCILCHTTVNCDKQFRVTQHRRTQKHQVQVEANSKVKQTFLPVGKRDFAAKLVDAFLAADIPLHKLQNAKIRALFNDLQQPVPSEAACRAHVDTLARQQLQQIKSLLTGKNVFMVVDESEVAKNKYVNILVGDTAAPEKTYLVESSVVTTVNQVVIASKVDDMVRKLEVPRDKFILLLSDAASYMTACTVALKIMFPKLFHVTCTAHLLHNCAENVRANFKDVDELIARTKATTVKNKSHRSMFDEIGSPPEPVVTRWGSWLNAAFYYAENLQAVRDIVNGYEGDGKIIDNAKAAVNCASVAESLMKIKRDYEDLPKLIQKFESAKFSISEAHAELHNINLHEDSARIGGYLKKRLQKNADLDAIVNMERQDISPALYADLQRCQATSASVERSFSMLKKMLVKDRPFLSLNVEKYLSVYYNKF